MESDIRDTPADEYWSEFEHKWTALLSYRYLGKVSSALDHAPEGTTMPLRHDMRNAAGGIMMLNVSPEKDGTIPKEQIDILNAVGKHLGAPGNF